MAEESQSPLPEPVPVEPTVAPPKPRWPLSRIVLLVLLVISVGLLAFDYFCGNVPQRKAFELLNSKLGPADTAKFDPSKPTIGKPVELFGPDDVHKLLGRSPDSTETNPAMTRELMRIDEDLPANKQIDPPALVEVYKYPGAFRSYFLRVGYAKSPVAKTMPFVMTGVKGAKE